jgi:hypothetical protein
MRYTMPAILGNIDVSEQRSLSNTKRSLLNQYKQSNKLPEFLGKILTDGI